LYHVYVFMYILCSPSSSSPSFLFSYFCTFGVFSPTIFLYSTIVGVLCILHKYTTPPIKESVTIPTIIHTQNSDGDDGGGGSVCDDGDDVDDVDVDDDVDDAVADEDEGRVGKDDDRIKVGEDLEESPGLHQ